MARLLFSVVEMTLHTAISVAAAATLLAAGCAPVSRSPDLVFQRPPTPDQSFEQAPAAFNNVRPDHPGLAFAPRIANGFAASPSFTIDRGERENAAFVGYESPRFTFFSTVTDDRQLSFPGWGSGNTFDRLDRRAVSVTVGSRQQ